MALEDVLRVKPTDLNERSTWRRLSRGLAVGRKSLSWSKGAGRGEDARWEARSASDFAASSSDNPMGTVPATRYDPLGAPAEACGPLLASAAAGTTAAGALPLFGTFSRAQSAVAVVASAQSAGQQAAAGRSRRACGSLFAPARYTGDVEQSGPAFVNHVNLDSCYAIVSPLSSRRS